MLALCALGGVAFSACAPPTGALAPSAGVCFEALPIASEALHDRGHLLGVRYLTLWTINEDLKKGGTEPIPTLGLNPNERVCVVGYRGPFKRSEVPSPWPPRKRRGAEALVVFSADRRHILHTVLVTKLPLRLSRI